MPQTVAIQTGRQKSHCPTFEKEKKTLTRENQHKNPHLTPCRESTLLNHLQWKKKRVTSGPHQGSAVSHLTINMK